MSRKLVLKLLCLEEKDKEWILNNLSEKELGVISPLLKQAESLNIVKENRLSFDLIDKVEVYAAPQMQKSSDDSKDIFHISKLPEIWQNILTGKEALNSSSKITIQKTPMQLKNALIRIARELDEQVN
ncbi:hypothetical protein [Teredinibacter sp. KSP-S5-2]|uniref:hypothetical protein n=1 Tax=Teredinibacter sp. KSP-S5-2 TaxID=3034506 RepID=UPI0029344CE6|nr:hypothetical protein [Teredinibacter sp. KSP-S5-2]WNO11339.1 hypothetical protein P5V12_09160 [Teredinibacter sp. KSP-S5-2]